MLKVTIEQAETHYEIHHTKSFYDGLIKYITSGPVVAIIAEGKNAVKRTRKLVGATDPADAECGSIRGDYAIEIGRNIVHAADSEENAIKECRIYFGREDIINYNN